MLYLTLFELLLSSFQYSISQERGIPATGFVEESYLYDIQTKGGTSSVYSDNPFSTPEDVSLFDTYSLSTSG